MTPRKKMRTMRERIADEKKRKKGAKKKHDPKKKKGMSFGEMPDDVWGPVKFMSRGEQSKRRASRKKS